MIQARHGRRHRVRGIVPKPILRGSRGRDEIAAAGSPTRRRRQGGQSLVEFALVIPIFMAMLISIVEFAFAFNAVLATDFASRDAALVGRRGGQRRGRGLRDPPDGRARTCARPPTPIDILLVEIYQHDSRGRPIGAATIYSHRRDRRAAPPDGDHRQRPVHAHPERLPGGHPLQRARRLRRIRPTVDHVGVKVTYRYHWKTPIGQAISTYLEVPAIQLHAHGARAVMPVPSTAARRRPRARGQCLVEFSLHRPAVPRAAARHPRVRVRVRSRPDHQYATREGARTGAALANGSKMARRP